MRGQSHSAHYPRPVATGGVRNPELFYRYVSIHAFLTELLLPQPLLLVIVLRTNLLDEQQSIA
eukprot:5083605-Prymnesium_polylepis.1